MILSCTIMQHSSRGLSYALLTDYHYNVQLMLTNGRPANGETRRKPHKRE